MLVLYVGGALGAKMVGGRYADLYGKQNLTYVLIVTVEEFLERSGIVVFIFALLSYISSHLKDARVHVDDGTGRFPP